MAVTVAVGCSDADPLGHHHDIVVGVSATGCGLEPAIGTGVLVQSGTSTFAVTTAHTIAGATAVELKSDELSMVARVVGFDPERDVAVLAHPDLSNGQPLAEPRKGASATTVVWSPDEGSQAFDTAVTRLLRVTIEDIYLADTVERQAFEFEGEIRGGDSGAPVLDESGSVLGIVYARSRNRDVGFAVSAPEIAAVLSNTVASSSVANSVASSSAASSVANGRCL